MEIKTLDTNGLKFIADNEGNVLHAYLDSASIPTIGIGMTYYPSTGKKVTMKDKPITLQQSYDMFKQMVKPYETAVWSVTRDDINQNQFNALVDFAYNVGVGGFKGSNLLKLINAKATNEALKPFLLAWNKITVNGKSKVSAALTARRLREYALFTK